MIRAPASASETRSSARHIVVMGVSGTGKTTVAGRLADHFGSELLEGDDLHPRANIEKMAAGLPLDDDDRAPWLDTLSLTLARHHAGGLSTVLTCSALKQRYRDTLRSRLPDDATVFFVHLQAPFALLRRRMESRDHFMPPSLLQSQLDTLEPLGHDEAGVVLDVSGPVSDVVAQAISAIEAG